MTREAVRPFLVTKDEAGKFRLTVRDTRFNSQGYPIVTSNLIEEIFRTAAEAKAFARSNFNARSGQYAVK